MGVAGKVVFRCLHGGGICIDRAGFAAAGVGRAGCAMPILNAGIAYVGRVNAGVTGAVELGHVVIDNFEIPRSRSHALVGAGRLGGWVSYAGWLAGLGVAGKVVFRCLHGGGICAAYVQTSSPHLQTNAEFSGCRSAALVAGVQMIVDNAVLYLEI